MLEVRDLSIEFGRAANPLRVVDGVSFDVRPAEAFGIVGESGSGKSMTALALLGLLPYPGRIAGGSIRFEGEEWVGLSERALRRLRGAKVAMIFQEPLTALNPAMTVGDQIAEAAQIHRRLRRRESAAEAVRLLRLVEIPAAERRAQDYPHELSGGMRQRVMIAIALACQPRLLLADEPTTALDVTVQAQIMDLLRELRRELGLAVVLISHDLGLVAEFADRVAVMYAGRIVEEAPAGEAFGRPAHPYTAGLIGAIPTLEGPIGALRTIPGVIPTPHELPHGCRFAPRCARRTPLCENGEPALVPLGDRRAACLRPLLEAAA